MEYSDSRGQTGNFNSHAHVERDICRRNKGAYAFYFNSHAHVERDLRFSTLALYHANFNSHAHVERDRFKLTLSNDILISTHTLTWSVTYGTSE